jgi:TRAP-type C4-dicarboxylate transport system substrate-binding protein
MTCFDTIVRDRLTGGWLTLLVCFLVAAAGPSARSARAGTKPETLIKFATLAPDGSTWMNVMHDFDDELRAATENRVGFKFYPGGVQGDEKDVLRKIRNGQLHAGGFTGFGLGAIAPEFRAMELPFMFRNVEEVDYVRDKMDAYFVDLYNEKGYQLLGWADVGFVYIFSNTPITSPQELQQAKVWTWSGDPLAAIFFKAFDVSPIPLALPDVLTSLQMGVVNAVYAPALACVALQWFTRVKYMTDVPITYGFGAMLMSNEMAARIGPQDFVTLRTLARKYGRVLIEKTRLQNVEAIEEIRKEGVTILDVDEKMTEVFFHTGRGAWKDGIGELYPAELLDRVSAEADAYRKDHEEAKKTP